MLQFIIGASGTGKTGLLIEKMRFEAQNGRKSVYLVPEQFSFEAEKLLYRRLGAKLALNVEVLSFTRLCDSVFRAFGGLAGMALSGTAKYLLMSIAVDELRDSLKLYRKSCFNTAFLETLVETCGEFKTAGITCRALSAFAGDCADAPLREKLSELSVIYAAYQGLIDRGYSDPDDDLIRACALLENNDYFKDYSVFVDGFTTFMAAEFELLGHAVRQARQAVFAMTADETLDRQRGMGVFSAPKSAMARLSRMAKNNGVAIAEPEVLTQPRRFLNPELRFIAEHFMRPAPAVYEDSYTGALTVTSAADRYGEVENAAAEIARLVREENCRYSEIAVVVRDTAPYEQAVESVFARYGLPYFLSAREDIENKPLISCVLAALNAVRGGFDATLVLLFAKSPLVGLSLESAAALENYCYCWGVRGALWKSPFTNNPRGLAGQMTEDDLALLDTVNTAREAVITPLTRLQDALRDPDGRQFASGIFTLLQELNASERLKSYAGTMPDASTSSDLKYGIVADRRCVSSQGGGGNKADACDRRQRGDEAYRGGCDAGFQAGWSALGGTFLDESAQLWDTLMGVLDIFGTVLKSRKMPARRFCELFKLAVNAAEIGGVPQTLDQVLIGAADRIRPAEMRCVFVLGANDGVFPKQTASSGVFSDTERRKMIDAGLEISAPALQKSVLENYFAYFALTLPSEWLRVSYCRSDLQGRELLPSSIVVMLCDIFPALPEPQADPLGGAATEKSAFDLFSRRYRENSALSATLREFFEREDKGAVLERMRRAGEKPPHALYDQAAAKALFGSFMRLSPSRVERFYKCPFSYFLSDGLNIRPRGKVDFSPLESGGVIHHVLQTVVQRHGGKALLMLSDDALKTEIAEIIGEYLAGLVDDINALPARIKFLFGRLPSAILRLLRRLGEEFSQSEFEPVAFELPINLNEGVEPLRLKTPDGACVVVEGKVDRVDVMNKNGRRYVRVIDYKSGAKNFALGDVLYGLNMQMLLYLFTIRENGADALENAIPAGVLYMPAHESFTSGTRGESMETVQKTREKALCMNGLLLDDEEALRGMEAELKGVFIPAKLGSSGKVDTKPLASLAQMGALARKVKEQIAQMAAALGKGAVEACPAEADGRLTCEYCAYRAVCGFEPGDAVKRIAKLDKEGFFKALEEKDA